MDSISSHTLIEKLSEGWRWYTFKQQWKYSGSDSQKWLQDVFTKPNKDGLQMLQLFSELLKVPLA